MKLAVALLAACSSLIAAESEESLRELLMKAKSGTVRLPSGTIAIAREIVLSAPRNLEINGEETMLRAAPDFRGRALLVIQGGSNVRVKGLAIDGNRDATDRMAVVPPVGQLIGRVLANNGILAEGVARLEISGLKAAHVAGFAILVGSSHDVKLRDLEISESGGFDSQRHNNGSGGIALEDGVTSFEISDSRFGGIRGTAVTLRSSGHGRIANNEFAVLARNALEAHQSDALLIENNHARQIGAPTEEVAGRVVCFRLEAVRESTIRGNTCEEALLGAIFLSGTHNTVTNNRLLHLNLASKIEVGILLGVPATGNTVEGNEISGSGMSRHCVEMTPAPPHPTNKLSPNDCSDEVSVAGLRLRQPH